MIEVKSLILLNSLKKFSKIMMMIIIININRIKLVKFK